MPTRPTAATQAYAVAPGLVAHSRDAYVCHAVVDGHPVAAKAAPGLALTAPLAERHALFHILVLHNHWLGRGWGARGPAEAAAAAAAVSADLGILGLPGHAQAAMRAVLREKAAKLVFKVLAARGHNVPPPPPIAVAAQSDAAADSQATEVAAAGMSAVQRMFRGIRGPWVLNLTEEALADLRELRRSQVGDLPLHICGTGRVCCIHATAG
jgi:hypothetical protein